jgi:hypothetical protein
MQLWKALRHLPNTLAPKACPFCDGGSGAIFDERLSTLRRCQDCNGTGLASEDGHDLQLEVSSQLRKSNEGRPSNVA